MSRPPITAGSIGKRFGALTQAVIDSGREAYAVIQTVERWFYGCFLLRRGVIGRED